MVLIIFGTYLYQTQENTSVNVKNKTHTSASEERKQNSNSVHVKELKRLIAQTKKELSEEADKKDDSVLPDEFRDMKTSLRNIRKDVVDAFETLVEDEAFFEEDKRVQEQIEKTEQLIAKLDERTGVNSEEIAQNVKIGLRQEVSTQAALETEEKLVEADAKLLDIEEQIDMLNQNIGGTE